MNTLEISIQGMHCRACTVVVADELKKLPGVTDASVSLKTNTATIRAKTIPSPRALAGAVKAAGYEISSQGAPFITRERAVYLELAISIAVVVVGYLLLRAFGVTEWSIGTAVGGAGTTALLVGLAAGFSTCMALVGGLVLGVSARFAARYPQATAAERFRPHLLFNLGRILAFFMLGGVVGAIGSIFGLSGSAFGLLTIAVGIVMIVMGLQLTGLFPRLSLTRMALPLALSKKLGLDARKTRQYSGWNTALLGALTFFLPCGFTQAMQLVAISSGSAATGALVMGLFAIGTTPGLLAIGGLTSLVRGDRAKHIFRFVGVMVIALAFYNIVGGVRLTGLQMPRSTAPQVSQLESQPVAPIAASKQTTSDQISPVVLRATYSLQNGIQPTNFAVETGKSYVLEIDPQDNGEGCMSTVMIPGLYADPQLLEKGKLLKIPFVAKKQGTYKLVCAMGLPFGATITAGQRS